jgi:prolyl-tRNA editing enzyme YbaK/EbsC (Cys-tRNA(Pro) deacylase)
MDFPKIYGAAGTPRHIFGISPDKLVEISNSQISDFVSLKKQM